MNIASIGRRLLATLGLSLLLPLSAAQAQASFDCNQISRVVDRIICSWGPVANADRALAARYKQALAAAKGEADRNSLRDDQLQWLKKRDRRCVGSMSAAQMGDDANPAYRTAARCLELAYAERIAALQDRATPPLLPLSVQTVPRTALGPATNPNTSDPADKWDMARLSPDASLLGASTAGRIWLYRRDNQHLFAITPAPSVAGTPQAKDAIAGTEGLQWANDNSLYGWAKPYHGAAQIFRATRDGAISVVGNGPNPIPNPIPDTESDLSRNYPIPNPDDASGATGNERFVVWVQNRGHGSLDLMLGKASDAKSGAEPIRLVRGSWELENFQFDLKHSRVFYATDTGIVAHDLASGVIRRIAGTRRHDVVMDFSSQAQLLVFQRNGQCEDQDAVNTKTTLREQAAHLCLAQLPAR